MEWDIVSELCSRSSILVFSECVGAKKNCTGVILMDFSQQRLLGLHLGYVGYQKFSLCCIQICTVCVAL